MTQMSHRSMFKNYVEDQIKLSTYNCVYGCNCFKKMLYSRHSYCVSCQRQITVNDLELVNDFELGRIFAPILENYISDKRYIRCLTPDCYGVYYNNGCVIIYCELCSRVYCLEGQHNYYGPMVSLRRTILRRIQ